MAEALTVAEAVRVAATVACVEAGQWVPSDVLWQRESPAQLAPSLQVFSARRQPALVA